MSPIVYLKSRAMSPTSQEKEGSPGDCSIMPCGDHNLILLILDVMMLLSSLG